VDQVFHLFLLVFVCGAAYAPNGEFAPQISQFKGKDWSGMLSFWEIGRRNRNYIFHARVADVKIEAFFGNEFEARSGRKLNGAD